MRRPVHSSVCPRTLLVLAVLVLTSCQTAYYAAMEKLGYPKRDLLVSRVQQARDSQQAAKEQFQSALERFREYRKFKRPFTPPERALGSAWRGEPAPVADALLRLDDCSGA